MAYKLLIINPGSTSTKIGVYEDEKEIFVETLRHSSDEIAKYDSIFEQREFRKDVIMNVLKENNFDVNTLDAVVGRGGMLKPIPGGTYEVNESLLNEIAKEVGGRAFIVDPVVVDELEPVARISGVPELPRKSKFHALNQKAVAKRFGKESKRGYENLNLIVVHMGGGVSVGAHKNGKVIDVNNALDGDGPFSPERSGAVPVGDLIKMCFSGEYTQEEVYKKIVGKGGYVAYLNTNDARDVLREKEEGNKFAELIYNAFIYQVSKSIGEMATVLKGKVDSIILTGGIAYSPIVVSDIKERVEWISNVAVYPGEDELLALAQGAIRVLGGEEEAKVY